MRRTVARADGHQRSRRNFCRLVETLARRAAGDDLDREARSAQIGERPHRKRKLAVVLDVRTRSEFDEIPRAFEQLNTMGIWPQILFLEASDQVIVRRQEHVRRPHPLQGDGPLLDGVAREREMLAALRAAADMVIDGVDRRHAIFNHRNENTVIETQSVA